MELEAGVTTTFTRYSTEWNTDLLFKKPWTLSKTVALGQPRFIHRPQRTLSSVKPEAGETWPKIVADAARSAIQRRRQIDVFLAGFERQLAVFRQFNAEYNFSSRSGLSPMAGVRFAVNGPTVAVNL